MTLDLLDDKTDILITRPHSAIGVRNLIPDSELRTECMSSCFSSFHIFFLWLFATTTRVSKFCFGDLKTFFLLRGEVRHGSWQRSPNLLNWISLKLRNTIIEKLYIMVGVPLSLSSITWLAWHCNVAIQWSGRKQFNCEMQMDLTLKCHNTGKFSFFLTHTC